MERIHAYIDESGAYGFNFDKAGNTSYFIITAVTVKESELKQVEETVENIRRANFGASEIKSSKIKGNNKRRIKILNDIKKLPLKAFVLVVNKKRIFENSGIKKSKTVFYKFLNEILYEELRRNFNKLVIEADGVGEKPFQTEFYNYVKKKEQPLSLFDESEFRMTDSKESILVQVADLISGTLSYCYEPEKIDNAKGYNYRKILDPVILLLSEFPKSYERAIEAEENHDPKFNRAIFEIAHRRAMDFIKNEKESEDEDTSIQEQKFVLEYLLFRFLNNSARRYIGTKELITALVNAGYKKRSTATFRMKIIGKLRDKGVIISSSTQGYKLPTTIDEICDYITHTETILMPMISRLNRCIEVVRTGSNGDIDLLTLPQYAELKSLLDNFRL